MKVYTVWHGQYEAALCAIAQTETRAQEYIDNLQFKSTLSPIEDDPIEPNYHYVEITDSTGELVYLMGSSDGPMTEEEINTYKTENFSIEEHEMLV